MTRIVNRSPHVTVIIVNFRSAEAAGRAFRSVVTQGYESYDVIVVNNSPGDVVQTCLGPCPAPVAVVEPGRNLGFARAVNLAATIATGDYLLLMNPDATLGEGVMRGLLQYLEQHPDTATAAPRILYPDGRLQPSRGKFPSLFTIAARLFSLKKLMPGDEWVIRRMPFLGRFFGQYRPLAAEQDVDYSVGCCVMVRADDFHRLGGFDERFFLFYEEIDLAIRLAAVGKRRVFINDLTVTHGVGESYREDSAIAFRENYLSLAVFSQVHGGVPFMLAVRVLQIIALLARIVSARVAGRPADELVDLLHTFSIQPLRTINTPPPDLVSACLLGIPCTYIAGHHATPTLVERSALGRVIGFCPEHAGGLPTPRPPAEITCGAGADVLNSAARVVTIDGRDVTANFLRGARRALMKARLHGVRRAITKARSPSCGVHAVYDGTHSGTLRIGSGVTTALLERFGIEVIDEEDWLANGGARL
ncbi:DUF523 domain-containing protein [bacterium]|nr:DUF523 domain-containing protein [candidate division CSSED10-310 bacterium]